MLKRFSMYALMTGLAIYGISMTACKDDDPVNKPGSLAFHIHTLIDATEVEAYGEEITRTDGRPLTVTQAQMYISNVKLIKSDGSVVDGPSAPVLVQQGVEEYELGDVPSGNYKTVRFDVGLSDAINGAVPSASDPVLNRSDMWFGATAQPDGFVFLNFQGTIDTSSAPYGGTLLPFAYKVGTNAHRVTVTMPDKSFTVVPEQLAIVHLEANYALLLDDINLKEAANLSITTAEENSWSWITELEAKIADMFEYEE